MVVHIHLLFMYNRGSCFLCFQSYSNVDNKIPVACVDKIGIPQIDTDFSRSKKGYQLRLISFSKMKYLSQAEKEFYNTNGFIKLENLLSDSEVEEASNAYSDLFRVSFTTTHQLGNHSRLRQLLIKF